MLNSIMTLHLRSISNKLIFTFSILCGLSLYLMIDTAHTFIYLLISFALAIPLIFKPKYLVFTIIIFASSLIVNLLLSESPTKGYINHGTNLKVTGMTSMGPIVWDGHHSIFIRTREELHIGDVINLGGKLDEIKNKGDFDIETYFKSLNVKSQVEFPSHINIVEHSNDFRINARKYILDGGQWYNKVTPLLLLGLKTRESREVYHLSIEMNIVHLFVISGFHISLFYLIFYKMLKLIRIPEKYVLWIPLAPIFVYLFILGFPISATRAMLLVLFSVINKSLLKSKFSTISILSFTMALMFIYKPWSVYSLSFIFTYIATYSVIFMNMLKYKNNFRRAMWISVIAFMSNIVIVIHTNHYFSVFGLIYGVVLSPLFVVMYSVTLFLFPLKDIMEFIDYSFVQILNWVSKTNILLDVPKFSTNYLFLFYGITLSSIIILVTWNLYTEEKGSLSTKKLIG